MFDAFFHFSPPLLCSPSLSLSLLRVSLCRGLGKTLQSISVIAHLVHVARVTGPHLVVVPLSVLFNWIQEFKKFCPSLKVLRVHAGADRDEQTRLKARMNDPKVTEVVVTTYDTLKNVAWRTLFRRIVWRSAFLDEGHRIKNEESDVSKACLGLRARFKVDHSSRSRPRLVSPTHGHARTRATGLGPGASPALVAAVAVRHTHGSLC